MINDIVENYINYPNVIRAKHSRLIVGEKFIREKLKYNIKDGRCLQVLLATSNGLATGVGDRNHRVPINEIVTIKNLFAMKGLAPRVYRIFEMGDEKKFTIVEQDYLGKWKRENIDEVSKKIRDYAEELNIEIYEQELTNSFNYVNGKFVDFHGFSFRDKDAYFNGLKERIRTNTHYGKNIDGEQIAYQSTKEFDGKRKTEYRISSLGLDKQDFKNKSVLDIGCNLGLFCQYASQKGAKEVLGVDLERYVSAAKEWANWKQYWDIDFEAVDLNTWKPKKKYDILLYLAVYEYFGLPKWVIDCSDVMYFEGHASTNKEQALAELKQHYNQVIDLGITDDRSVRPIFKCIK